MYLSKKTHVNDCDNYLDLGKIACLKTLIAFFSNGI